MNKKHQLSKNAVSRVQIKTESYWLSWKISFLLRFKYRFKRQGRYIRGFDEVVYHDYVKNNFVINSSWDIWSGYDWSADNTDTDIFLKEFYQRHLKLKC